MDAGRLALWITPVLLAGCQFLPGFLSGSAGPAAEIALSGKVLDPAGRPAVGAKVLIYPITNTNPVTNVNPYKVAFSPSAEGKPPRELETDGEGIFKLPESPDGEYNVEAFIGDDLKAWKPGLALAKGKRADAGTLTLAAPGRLRGKVTVASPLVTDRSAAIVYIPGSRYSSVTDAGGLFDLGAVPAAAFTVKAYHPDLGRGEAQIAVSAGSTAEAEISLAAEVPRVAWVTRAGTEFAVQAAPPGGEIDIQGDNFGVARGARILVSFSGATGLAPVAISDTVLRVKVPGDAKSGYLRVLVGNLPSAEVPFTIASSLDLRFDSLTLVDRGPCYDLGRVILAKDAEGGAVARDAILPFLTWEAAEPGRASVEGRITATTAGTFSVTARAGDLVARTAFTALGVSSAVDCRLAFPPGVSTLAGAGTEGLANGGGPSASFKDPHALRVSGEDLLVADTGNSAVRKIDRDGIVSTFMGGAPGYGDGSIVVASDFAPVLQFPVGLELGDSGSLLIADTYSHRIRKVVEGVVSTFAGEAIAYGGGFRDGSGTEALFSKPYDLARASDGTLYVADHGNHAIRKITVPGEVSTLAGTASVDWADGPGISARFAKPSGLAVDASGSVYVADRDNQCIRLIAPDGQVTTVAGTASVPRVSGALTGGYLDGPAATAQFKRPTSLAFGPDGALYIADSGNKRIRKLAGGVVETVAGAGTDGSDDGPLLSAKFRNPASLTVGADGTIYVADDADDKIRVIRP